MPRKRRIAKRRPSLPQGLSAISQCERSLWATLGPLIGNVTQPPVGVDVDSDPSQYVRWPDWGTWCIFYGAVRDELFADRPHLRERATCERLYSAWRDGRDLDAVRAEIAAERAAHDPRLMLFGGSDAA